MTGPLLPSGKIPGTLLADLLRRYPIADQRVLIGPGMGRDAAALQMTDTALVIKTDPITFPTDDAAWHLVHINSNDLACQGATPRWLLVTALLPAGETTTSSVIDIFERLHAAASSIGIVVIGGHTEVTDGVTRPILMGTMLGDVPTPRLVDPTRAQSGDRLLMTASAGIEGTAILAHSDRSSSLPDEILRTAKRYVESPGISVLAAARALHDADAVSAMHDPTEGGIATAVREMAMAAEAGAVISRPAITVTAETQAVCKLFGIDPLGLLSSGSLLAAVPKERMERAEAALVDAGVPFAWIGKLTNQSAGYVLRDGLTESPLPEFAVDELARVFAEGA